LFICFCRYHSTLKVKIIVQIYGIFYYLILFFLNKYKVDEINQTNTTKFNKTYADKNNVTQNIQPDQSENDTYNKYTGDISPQKIKIKLRIISLLILGLSINLVNFLYFIKIDTINDTSLINPITIIGFVLSIALIISIISQVRIVSKFIKNRINDYLFTKITKPKFHKRDKPEIINCDHTERSEFIIGST